MTDIERAFLRSQRSYWEDFDDFIKSYFAVISPEFIGIFVGKIIDLHKNLEVIKAAREKVNCSNCADRLEITKKLIEITDNLVNTAYTKVSCLNCVDNHNLNQKLLEITQKFQKLELCFVQQ